MKKFIAATAIATVAATGVMAQEPEVSTSAEIVSDYVWRGESQGDSWPAVQGGFEVDTKIDGAYFGVWGSTLSHDDAEIDVYGGVKKDKADVGIISYTTLGDGGRDVEVYAGYNDEKYGSYYVYNNIDNGDLYFEAKKDYKDFDFKVGYDQADLDFGVSRQYGDYNVGLTHKMDGSTRVTVGYSFKF